MSTEIDLEVSVNNLQEQWESLPEDVKVWGSQLAEAVQRQQLADHKLTLAEARASIAIRKNPLEFGFPKVTEDQVKALVQVQPEVEQATDALIAAKNEVTSLKAIVEALDVKRSALKYLSELTLVGFTATLPAGVKKRSES